MTIWDQAKSIVLAAVAVFLSTFSTVYAATPVSGPRTTVISALSAAGTAVLLYLGKLIPNPTTAQVKQAKATAAQWKTPISGSNP